MGKYTMYRVQMYSNELLRFVRPLATVARCVE